MFPYHSKDPKEGDIRDYDEIPTVLHQFYMFPIFRRDFAGSIQWMRLGCGRMSKKLISFLVLTATPSAETEILDHLYVIMRATRGAKHIIWGMNWKVVILSRILGRQTLHSFFVSSKPIYTSSYSLKGSARFFPLQEVLLAHCRLSVKFRKILFGEEK